MVTRKSKANRRITMRDIANQSGVSVMTVSKALNDKPGVSVKTARRIKKVAEELKYTPNLVAKNLRLDRTRCIGVVVSDSSEMVTSVILRGLIDTAEVNEYNIIISNTDSNPSREKRSIELLCSEHVDGLVIVASTITNVEDTEWIHSLGVPTVLVMRQAEDSSLDSVISNNYLGGYLIGKHIMEQNGNYICALNIANKVLLDRIRGTRDALDEHDQTLEDSHIYSTVPQIEPAYEETLRIIARHPKMDTLVCGCDVIAIGAMQAIIDKGLAIPEDIRVTGFDGIPLAEHLRVPLTTVNQAFFEIGKKGILTLLDRINDPDIPIIQTVLNVELAARESSIRPKG